MTAIDKRPLAEPQEVASFLGVELNTLRFWRYKGIGPKGYRVGRHLRYKWSDVESWLEEQPSGRGAA